MTKPAGVARSDAAYLRRAGMRSIVRSYSGRMASSRPYLLAAGLGVVAGLRSMTAPAILSRAAHLGPPGLVRSPFRLFGHSTVGTALAVLAVGELVVDKIPFIPARTKPGPLTGRALSGALCGAIVCHAAGESSLNGAAVGALGAVAGSFAGRELRRLASDRGSVSGWVGAFAEDAIAIGAGAAALSRFA